MKGMGMRVPKPKVEKAPAMPKMAKMGGMHKMGGMPKMSGKGIPKRRMG